jgi:hypothetical protein
VADAHARTERAAALLRGAAQWRDPQSHVRRRARETLVGGEWPPEVVDVALSQVLLGAEDILQAAQPMETGVRALAILPGNILGPAIACAYCAAAAGAELMLKSSHRELELADVVAQQFQELGSPLAGTLRSVRWSGGDEDFEAKIFPLAQRIVVFGDDATIDDVKRRAPEGTAVQGYGSAYSIGYVPAGCDMVAAADAAAHDVALFDQRGCLSPQTIYVEGDESRTILFAHALSGSLDTVGRSLPRAAAGQAEKQAVAEFIRRLMLRALAPKTHALGTVLVGPDTHGVPEYVVGAEPYSSPVCAGFGRIVTVKPCAGVAAAADGAKTLGHKLDTVGVAGEVGAALRALFEGSGALRICALGEMQRPPLGYRPQVEDFAPGGRA